jgi:hypothetical protein
VLSIKRRNIKVNGFKPIEIICEPQDTKTKEPFVFKNIDEELARVVMKYLWDKRKTEWLFRIALIESIMQIIIQVG